MAKANVDIDIDIEISVVSRDYVVQAMTGVLRAAGWKPWKEHVCGCKPDALCTEHAAIRLAEHYSPKERPRCTGDPAHFADSHDPGGAYFGVSHKEADHPEHQDEWRP